MEGLLLHLFAVFSFDSSTEAQTGCSVECKARKLDLSSRSVGAPTAADQDRGIVGRAFESAAA
jgi:hypothetical protein